MSKNRRIFSPPAPPLPDEPVDLSGAPPALPPANGEKPKAPPLTPRERFLKYRTKRLLNFQRACKHVGIFGSSGYQMEDRERDFLLAQLKAAYDDAVARIRHDKQAAKVADPWTLM